ncbi:MAG TPA: histone deacetylase, partial [Roseiflexaceae bacterium]|nr:histone deacetylase [Roseiflexaceae bacterium]
MEKYRRLRERIVAAAVVPPEHLRVPHAATDTELLRAHDREYLRRCQAGELTAQEIRRIGFPWSPQMVERSRRSSGATIEACRAALEDGLAANLAGGTHHAYRDHGEGYCVFNDSAVAARAMQAEGRARRVVIVDCDVHQGNGTASILAGDETIFTFSIHGANNFPFHKEQSDLDIALEDAVSDQAYLDALDDGLSQAIELSRADLAIFLAGA